MFVHKKKSRNEYEIVNNVEELQIHVKGFAVLERYVFN